MGLRWAAKNGSPIGIDFGSDSVKILQLLPEDPPHIVAAASIEIPSDARKQPEAQQNFLITALKDVMRDCGFRGKRIITSISSAHSYIQHVRPPQAEGEMLEQQIELELRGRLPMDPSNMVVRHIPVGDVVVDGVSKQEMICFAASRGYVMRIVNIVKSAGFDVVGMHCEPVAILESFAHLFRRAEDEKQTTLFIDIGGSTTQALIAHGSKLVFAKTIHIGGEHFARHHASRLDISLNEVRERNARGEDLSVLVPAGGAAGGPNGEMQTQVQASPHAVIAPTASPTEQSMNEIIEVITDELKLCFGYHKSLFADRSIDRVIFLGGESRNHALCKSIAKVLGIPAQTGCPLARLVRTQNMKIQGIELNAPQPGWAVPVGLCMLPSNL